jgi:hypothetical protein
MCSNNETTTSQYNKDLEISINKYQVSSDVLRKLEDEGFNTEFLKPERQPTFDELIDQLMSIGETTPIQHSTTHYSFELNILNWINWLIEFKSYLLHTNVLDPKIIEFHYLGHTVRITTPSPDSAGGCFHYLQCLATNMLGRKCKLYDYTNNRSFIAHIAYYPHYEATGEKQNEANNICLEICTILSMDHLNFSRLNKTINAVETLNCDILAQGRELTDHCSTLDLISETVDNNAQDFIKHEQLYKLQFNELEGRVLNMETSSTTTTNTTTIEIQNIKKIINEHKTIIEVLSANIDNHSQTEDLMIFQHRQLNSIYLHLEERVSKMETIQKTDIQTMETYITKFNQRLAIMDKREEQTTEEVNSKMKHFEKQIKQLEDNVQDLNRYNQWVLLIATNLIIISYVVYKVIYIL